MWSDYYKDIFKNLKYSQPSEAPALDSQKPRLLSPSLIYDMVSCLFFSSKGLPHSTASLETLASLLTQYSSGQNLTLHPLPYTFHEHLPLTVSLC